MGGSAKQFENKPHHGFEFQAWRIALIQNGINRTGRQSTVNMEIFKCFCFCADNFKFIICADNFKFIISIFPHITTFRLLILQMWGSNRSLHPEE